MGRNDRTADLRSQTRDGAPRLWEASGAVLGPPPRLVGILRCAACVCLAGVLETAVGCGSSEAEKDARQLLQLLESMTVDGSLAERAEQVSRLKALKLVDPALRQTREACLTAHGRLLEAELVQAELRNALKHRGRPALGPEPAENGSAGLDPMSLADRFAASEAAVGAAREALPQCRARSRELLERIR